MMPRTLRKSHVEFLKRILAVQIITGLPGLACVGVGEGAAVSRCIKLGLVQVRLRETYYRNGWPKTLDKFYILTKKGAEVLEREG